MGVGDERLLFILKWYSRRNCQLERMIHHRHLYRNPRKFSDSPKIWCVVTTRNTASTIRWGKISLTPTVTTIPSRLKRTVILLKYGWVKVGWTGGKGKVCPQKRWVIGLEGKSTAGTLTSRGGEWLIHSGSVFLWGGQGSSGSGKTSLSRSVVFFRTRWSSFFHTLRDTGVSLTQSHTVHCQWTCLCTGHVCVVVHEPKRLYIDGCRYNERLNAKIKFYTR